ncbi:MAG: hypothetical protein BA864_15930 [Desulfuromonadales bacterium C00003093]|nr:MAG: hypothetical protein BA864_15930 [Desulfuromonadales bacterium C00003093]
MLIISLIVLGLSSLLNLYFSIQILRRMIEADIKVSFFELRWQVHKHLKSYCAITKAESGRIGWAFYGYWVTLALVLGAVVTILARLGADTVISR